MAAKNHGREMNIIRTHISDVLIIEPKLFGDDRGFMMESFNHRNFEQATGLSINFVQDNHSLSERHVLRGLHYQIENTQAKLVRVIAGEIFDVAVDLRQSSPTFGQWVGTMLSADNKRQIFIPEGFAHGFLTLSERAECLYKVSDYYSPAHERCLIWNDPRVGIKWPLDGEPILSQKDSDALPLSQCDVFK